MSFRLDHTEHKKSATSNENKEILITHPIYFNQMLKPSDLKSIGNCYAYSILFFTYISCHLINHPKSNIDYSDLLLIFNTYDSNKKKKLSAMQEKYNTPFGVNYREIMDNEVSILNDNSHFFEKTDYFSNFCGFILNDINHFYAPVFYFFSYWRENKFLGVFPVSHSVAFYLPSPDELHFFDSLSGLHILKLPSRCNKNDLHDKLIELLFKQNKFLKYCLKLEKASLIYEYERTVFPEKNYEPANQKIRAFLQSTPTSVDDKFLNDVLVENKYLQKDHIRGFLERHTFILQTRKNQHTKQTRPSYSNNKLLFLPAIVLVAALYSRIENPYLSILLGMFLAYIVSTKPNAPLFCDKSDKLDDTSKIGLAKKI